MQCAWHTRKSTAHPSCDIKTPVRVSRAQRSSRRPERDSARSDALDSKPCWRDCGCPASARPCAYRARSEAAAVQNAIQCDPTRLTASRVGEIVGVPLPHPSCDIKTPVRVSRTQRSSRRPERDSARSDALDSKPCWRDCGCPASVLPLRRDCGCPASPSPASPGVPLRLPASPSVREKSCKSHRSAPRITPAPFIAPPRAPVAPHPAAASHESPRICLQSAPLAPTTGLVQQTVQIVAAHDLTLFVMHLAQFLPPVVWQCDDMTHQMSCPA